jgi:hypothetical protein
MLQRDRSWYSGLSLLHLADGAYANRSLAMPAPELAIMIVSGLRSRLSPVRTAAAQASRPVTPAPR